MHGTNVLMHGTKLPDYNLDVFRIERVLQAIKHLTTKELAELVEAIANVNSNLDCS